MARPKKHTKEELDAMLFEEDEEDMLPRALDKGLILLRHIDRINRVATLGETFGFINSVEQFAHMLQPYYDKIYVVALKKEKEDFKKALSSLDSEDLEGKSYLDVKYYGEVFRLLMELLNRRGMW